MIQFRQLVELSKVIVILNSYLEIVFSVGYGYN